MKADNFARQLREFGPTGILAVVVVLAGNFLFTPLSALLVLAWARRSDTPWSEIGFVRPKSWPVSIALGVAGGIVFKLVMKAIVMPLLGAPEINQTYHFLAGNPAALPAMFYAVVVGAGFGEETLFRGYMFERLGKLLGSGVYAMAFIVLLTSALFAVAHYPDQGIAGVEQAAITGLVFGSVFATTGRIYTLMITHAVFDLTAVAIIFLDLEYRVAHSIFN